MDQSQIGQKASLILNRWCIPFSTIPTICIKYDPGINYRKLPVWKYFIEAQRHNDASISYYSKYLIMQKPMIKSTIKKQNIIYVGKRIVFQNLQPYQYLAG